MKTYSLLIPKLHSPLKLGVAVVVIGMLFRIQHWEYGNQILAIGIIIMVLGYFYDLITKEKRGIIDFIKMGLVLFMAIAYLANLLQYPILSLLVGAGYYSFWGFLLVVGWEMLVKGKEGPLEKIGVIIYGICAILITLGVGARIQHWEGSSYLIIGGTVLAAAWVLLSPYLGRK